VDDITVEVKEEGAEHQFFQAPAIEPLPMRMPMVTVNQLDWLYFKNRCSSCSWQYSSHLETRAFKVLLVLHPQSQMQVEQQMHRLPIRSG
jgi:hypothetical protein